MAMPWPLRWSVSFASSSRGLVVLLWLLCLARLVSSRGPQDQDPRPKYARLYKNIETIWQRPRGEPKGIFFMAHGCMHQGTDWFTSSEPDGWQFNGCKTSNYGDCLGLPEEVRMRQVARARGYLVVAVSGGSGRQSCWNLRNDLGRVSSAISHVRLVEALSDKVPVFAMGGSSGGALVGALASAAEGQGTAVPGLACIIPVITSLNRFKNPGIPTLFVHMPRDRRTRQGVEWDIHRFQGNSTRVAQLHLRPRAVSLELLGRCLDAAVSGEVLTALRKADLLDSQDFLKENPRRGRWRSAVQNTLRGRSADTLRPGESCLDEELNVAWAMHEFSSEYAEEMIDFCENASAAQEGRTSSTSSLRGMQTQNGEASSSPGPVDSHRRQLLVFDAGSSGTRVHVFDMLPPPQGAHVPTLLKREGKKAKPGLSHFARTNNLTGVDASLTKLLDFANSVVPAEMRSKTPALLKATAGLRAVSEAQAAAVLGQVRKSLEASGYLFRPAWADIIQGKEEAGLAWVAANFLQGTFSGDREAQSLGIIELGGGSTQVSFQVSPTSRLAAEDSFTFTTAGGARYHLYAHSYLGYGQDYAQTRLRDEMPKALQMDPCYPPGYIRSSRDLVEIRGSGNASGCSALIEGILFEGSTSAPGHYAGELQLRGRFLATQNFFFARQDLNLPMPGSEAEMQEQSVYGCSRPLLSPSSDPGKPNGCFGLCYQHTMLRALGVYTLPQVTVEIANTVKGGDADWALGAALVHLLAGPPEDAEAAVATMAAGPGGVGGALSTLALLMSLGAGMLLLVVLRITVWPRLRSPRMYKMTTSPDASKVGRATPAE